MTAKRQYGSYSVLLILLVAGVGQSIAGMEEASSFFATLNSGECVPYDNITTYLHELEAAYSSKVQLVYQNVTTTEGRRIYMVIVKPYLDDKVKNAHSRDRKSYWVEAGFEAKACDTVSIALAFIHKLVTNCPEGYCHHDYYFIPLLNPDGHEYHRTTDIYWYKNRDVHENFTEMYTNCLGVRLDYNFPPSSTFYGSGSDDNPCSSYYRGEGPASAPEVGEVIRLKTSAGNLTLAITIQSEGTVITYPSSHSYEEIPEKAEYETIGKAYTDYMLSSMGQVHMLGSYSTIHTLHSGTSMDFWYHEQPSCYSYTLFIEFDSNQENENMFTKAQKYIGGVLAMISKTNEH